MKLWKKNSLWRSLLIGAIFISAVVYGFEWIQNSFNATGIPDPLRKVLEFNEGVSNKVFKHKALAREFDKSLAGEPKVNGDVGLGEDFNPATWKLEIEKDGNVIKKISLKEIKSLPFVEMTTEFKCVEGWSKIVNWGGARLSDLLTKYNLLPPNETSTWVGSPFSVGLSTPDDEYFVGIDMATAMHPQTLLVYKMNGEDLPLEHGAPLRLATPLKYGIKNIKRIGHLYVQKGRASDYWAKRGYDWDAGH